MIVFWKGVLGVALGGGIACVTASVLSVTAVNHPHWAASAILGFCSWACVLVLGVAAATLEELGA